MQTSVLKAMANALKVKFEIERNPYNPEFVRKILQSRGDVRNGKGVKIALEDLWK